MIQIKPANFSDLLIINGLAHRIWPVAYKDILEQKQLDYMLENFYNLSILKKQAEEFSHNFIIVYDAEKPVGFASYSPKENSEDVYRLHKIYILGDQQGKNIGRKIIDFIISQAKSANAKKLELNVNRNNKAKYFYEKLGFKIISEVDIDIGNGYFMNDYVMDKNLNDQNY